MANVINRTTLEYLTSVNTPDYPTGSWIINPDLSALTNVPSKYWKVVADSVLQMNTTEKNAVDDIYNTASGVAFRTAILDVIAPDPLVGVSGTVTVSGGLNLVTNIPNLITNDITTVSADPSKIKNVMVSVVYSTASGTFGVVAREKTTENYSELLNKELLTKDLAEFSLAAGGSTLIKI